MGKICLAAGCAAPLERLPDESKTLESQFCALHQRVLQDAEREALQVVADVTFARHAVVRRAQGLAFPVGRSQLAVLSEDVT